MIAVPMSVAIVIFVLGAAVWIFEKVGKANKRYRNRQTRQGLQRDLNQAPPSGAALPYGFSSNDKDGAAGSASPDRG